jgi:hypothetical protein
MVGQQAWSIWRGGEKMFQKIVGKISRINEPPYGKGYVIRLPSQGEGEPQSFVVWDSDLSDQTERLKTEDEVRFLSAMLGEKE